MNFLRRFWNWLTRKDKISYHYFEASAPIGPEPPTPDRIRPKPRKAIHQDYGRFFKGKGARPHRAYRRSVKAKIQPDDSNV